MKKALLTLFVCVFLLTGWVASTGAENHESESGNSVYLPMNWRNRDFSVGTPIFGVQMYGSTGENSAYSSYLRESQTTWVRSIICWSCVEPVNVAPNAYDWRSVDATLGAAAFSGVKVIATLRNNPDWAAPFPDSPLYEEHVDELVEFSRAVVERYDGDGVDDAPGSPVVRHWELYNEPDAAIDSWTHGWGNHGEAYAQMLEAVYPAIKSEDPAAKVLIGGLAYDRFTDTGGDFVRQFLDDVLAAGGGAYFDIMNFHYYPVFGPIWNDGKQGAGLIAKTEFLREKLRSYGLEKPIMITEAGWHSDGQGTLASTPEIQARYVVSLFTQSLATDVDAMIWWMFFDPGGWYPANGLVTKDPYIELKPAYFTFQTLVERLGRAHYQRTLPAAETGDPQLLVYEFRNNETQSTIYVAWRAPVETEEAHTLQLQAGRATVYDIYGGQRTVSDGDDIQLDGKISVQVSGRPVYVEVDW